jgi:hypothetical protein
MTLRALTHEILDDVRRIRAHRSVSIYLPARGPQGSDLDPSLLRALLQEAEGLLASLHSSAQEISELLAPGIGLSEALQGNRIAAAGLAIFTAPGISIALRLESQPEPLVEVDSRFVVAPLFAALAESEEGRRRILALHAGARARGQLLEDLSEVLAAAAEGRVHTLFLVPGRRRWGTFDETSLQVRPHAIRESGDQDLVELAISMTLATGGTVCAVPTTVVVGGSPVAAILSP